MTTLKEQIDSQEIDQNSYSARGTVGGKSAVYGGQIVGQALTAAFKSIQDLDPAFLLHSVHCYFVSPTLYDRDILYKVRRIKEGKSFCNLTVEASQVTDKEKITFKCMASFYKAESTNNALDLVTSRMPIVPHPDYPDTPVESDRRYIVKSRAEDRLFHKGTLPDLDFRVCFTAKEIEDHRARRPADAKYVSWIKANSGYTHQDHQNFHRSALAYNSDFFIGGCVLNAFPNVKLSTKTSLDHSIWFHADVNSQDWHLFVFECEHCAGGRSLNALRIYREDGTLVATGKQEAYYRPKL